MMDDIQRDKLQPEADTDINEIVVSERAQSQDHSVGLTDVLRQMGETYRSNPVLAVRGQAFIKQLHQYIGTQLEARLTKFAKSRGIKIKYEATVLGSTKPKDVDVAVIDPANGPLVIVGVRSDYSARDKSRRLLQRLTADAV